MPKMGQNRIISSFLAQRAKKASAEGQSSPQELEVGPRSGPYLLVTFESGIAAAREPIPLNEERFGEWIWMQHLMKHVIVVFER